jgi:hypothetical protein
MENASVDLRGLASPAPSIRSTSSKGGFNVKRKPPPSLQEFGLTDVASVAESAGPTTPVKKPFDNLDAFSIRSDTLSAYHLYADTTSTLFSTGIGSAGYPCRNVELDTVIAPFQTPPRRRTSKKSKRSSGHYRKRISMDSSGDGHSSVMSPITPMSYWSPSNVSLNDFSPTSSPPSLIRDGSSDDHFYLSDDDRGVGTGRSAASVPSSPKLRFKRFLPFKSAEKDDASLNNVSLQSIPSYKASSVSSNPKGRNRANTTSSIGRPILVDAGKQAQEQSRVPKVSITKGVHFFFPFNTPNSIANAVRL